MKIEKHEKNVGSVTD